MNRFKTKKKGVKDLEPADPRPSIESESSFSLFRRGKKAQEQETKQDIDLSSALPSNDDFRTSLLMSGLSARFSMLREQDDPNSKMGKASDDSVLYPKRQSRLADFGFVNGNGLGDIAEVESIRASPFLRTESVASTESGGMMTRSRPLESNVLFGGRQKIYKIAAGATSAKSVGDGMGGRALYDDDVAMSAFQRWRLAEKEKETDTEETETGDQSGNDNVTGDEVRKTEHDSFIIARSESPDPHGYNKKRETSSTTSSAPSGGRNSTAATSVVSQPTAASSASSTPVLERHVTRTRRLYEQSLTQDLQEQQHSVLSKVDTLARRFGGARTPELSPNMPSPTAQTFVDRWGAFGGERRTIMSKGSAPNLRSISPPATSPLNGKMDLNTRVSNAAGTKAADAKAGLLTSPPLSPPISDAGTGEQAPLHIQPRDLGKATAMNMFQKPNSTYDDSKYTERQRQLQQGRETPTQRSEDEVKSVPDPRSQSEASPGRQDSDIKTTTLSVPKRANASGQQDSGVTFLDDGIESPILNEHVISNPTSPEVRLERPSDQDHPALRGLVPLTSQDLFSAANEQHQPERAGYLAVSSQTMLADSPTLGPNVGLSGMVRQHLRSESDVSSIYAPQNDPQSPPYRRDGSLGSRRPSEDQDGAEAGGNGLQQSPLGSKPLMPRLDESPKTIPNSPSAFLDSPRSPRDEDEFANQLANARRRVREKLTSFVETDPSSFSPPAMAAPSGDLPVPPSRSNPLGILRTKTSRGSLSDRSREATMRSTREQVGGYDTEARLNEEEDAHPSLRAFRQVRREVQRRNQPETTARQLPQNGLPTSPSPAEPMAGARRGATRTPSTERQHVSPRQYRQMGEDSPQDAPRPPPRSQSRPARERSGSENSDGSSRQRNKPPPRLKDRAEVREGQPMPSDMLNTPGSLKPKMRSPGLPGTDIRHSPHVPPVARSPSHEGSQPSSNTRILPGRSLTGPMPSGPFSSQPGSAPGSAPPTPSILPSRRPSIPTNPSASTNGSTLTDSMKRVINKRDISEPTFLMSTSRVPTTNLPPTNSDSRGNRSRSGSVAGPNAPPPPLPPVNPRRRRDSSKTRTMMGGLMGGRRSDESDNAAFSASTPQLPMVPPPAAPFAQAPEGDRNSAFSISDDEEGPSTRRKLRKAASEMRMDIRANSGSKRANPPPVAVGPPAGRAVVMGSRGGPSPRLPGGMF